MMNLEDAMEKILELTDRNKELEDQIQSYEIKRQDYESKLESNASEISRLKELNMKYFTRLTVEKEETHVEERVTILLLLLRSSYRKSYPEVSLKMRK